MGLIITVVVVVVVVVWFRHREHPGSRRSEASSLGRLSRGGFSRLELIWAEGAYYGGELVEWVRRFLGWALEIVKRPKEQKGFVVLRRRRWVVERTLGWLGRYGRLSKD
jgi:transposase